MKNGGCLVPYAYARVRLLFRLPPFKRKKARRTRTGALRLKNKGILQQGLDNSAGQRYARLTD